MAKPARSRRSQRLWFGVRSRSTSQAAPPARAPAGRGAELFAALDTYVRDHGELAEPGDLTRFERRAFSQNGEDGIVAEILRRVGVGPRWFVEFGVGSGHEGVCVALADVLGWSGLFIESDPLYFERLERKYVANERVETRQALVDAETVDVLFSEAGVPEHVDVLSVDVDGNDWWIWRALTVVRPSLVVVEYNGNLDPRSLLVKPYDRHGSWDRTCWFGASLGAFERLAGEKGYTLVYTDLHGVNAFFLRDDQLDSFGPVSAPRRVANYDLGGGRMPGDPVDREWVDLATDTAT